MIKQGWQLFKVGLNYAKILSYLFLFMFFAWAVLWIVSLIDGQPVTAKCAMVLACLALHEIYHKKGEAQ